MSNNNGNGVSVTMREKAEQILVAKHQRVMKQLDAKRKEMEKKYERQLIAELKLEEEFSKLKELKGQLVGLEASIEDKTGYHYSGYYSIEGYCGSLEKECVSAGKFQELLDKRMKEELDYESEKARLEELKDTLKEELWLAGQSQQVKEILSRMQ